MLAFHGSQAEKDAILAQLRAHYEADEIVKGQYWEGGKGCAVGCTVHSGDHSLYETRFGIPQILAYLEDVIFEGLPNAAAKEWPLRFMGAIAPGADLSRIGWQFLHWFLTDPEASPGISHPLVRDAVARCAELMRDLADGKPIDEARACAAAYAADSAADSATPEFWSAADSVSRSDAWGVARTADGASWRVARSAAWGDARSAARSAAYAADSAARIDARSAARSAAYAADSDTFVKMAWKLISLLEPEK